MPDPTPSPTPRPRLLDLKFDESDRVLVEAHTVYLGTNGYAYYSNWENGRSYPRTLHSLIVGPTPPKSHIDHINGDKLDNRRENLRVVSPGRNQVNRHGLNKNNGSGARGVTVRKSGPNPYIAQIMVDRKVHHLGSFPTLESAVAARRAAELEHWGELCP